MTIKRNIIHPNFIIGMISYVLLLIGIVLNANSIEAGQTLMIVSVLLGGVHWFRSVFDVQSDPAFKSSDAKQYFWFALIIMIPPLAGMMYYMIHDKRISL
jgi:hypothetical protein